MSEPIVQAGSDRVPDLAALLGRAFADDPMLVWPFGAEKTEVITDFFRAFDERISELGWLWEAGAGLGVAAWIPPGSDQVMMDIDRSMRSTLAAAETRHEEMWEWIADNFPREPFWYLDHLAVEVEHRGTGLGAALIGAMQRFPARYGGVELEPLRASLRAWLHGLETGAALPSEPPRIAAEVGA